MDHNETLKLMQESFFISHNKKKEIIHPDKMTNEERLEAMKKKFSDYKKSAKKANDTVDKLNAKYAHLIPKRA